MQICPFFHNLPILRFSEIVIFMIFIIINRMITARTGLHSVLLPLLIVNIVT